MKKSSKINLTLTLAVALSLMSCNNGGQTQEWGQSYGRNNRGDSIMRQGGQDYYYYGNRWMLIPNGYYGPHYINGSSAAHGGYVNEGFRSSYSSHTSTSSSRGGFGSTGRGFSSGS
jgi:hypothetical protein